MSTDAKLGLVAGVLAVVGVAAFGRTSDILPRKPDGPDRNIIAVPAPDARPIAVPAMNPFRQTSR